MFRSHDASHQRCNKKNVQKKYHSTSFHLGHSRNLKLISDKYYRETNANRSYQNTSITSPALRCAVAIDFRSRKVSDLKLELIKLTDRRWSTRQLCSIETEKKGDNKIFHIRVDKKVDKNWIKTITTLRKFSEVLW